MRSTFIFNKKYYKNGIAMLKINPKKYNRVPVMPVYKFNRYSRKWENEFYVKQMENTIEYEKFYLDNKEQLVKGKNEIRITIKKFKEIKENNMKEYRRKIKEEIERRTNTSDIKYRSKEITTYILNTQLLKNKKSNKKAPMNTYKPNLKSIGWNCRSLTQNKILYINHLIEEENPDWIFVWEHG